MSYISKVYDLITLTKWFYSGVMLQIDANEICRQALTVCSGLPFRKFRINIASSTNILWFKFSIDLAVPWHSQALIQCQSSGSNLTFTCLEFNKVFHRAKTKKSLKCWVYSRALQCRARNVFDLH